MQTLRDAVVGKYYIVKKINGSGPLIRNLHKEGGATWRPCAN